MSILDIIHCFVANMMDVGEELNIVLIFDGVLYISEAKTSRKHGGKEWVETLTNAMEDKKHGSYDVGTHTSNNRSYLF